MNLDFGDDEDLLERLAASPEEVIFLVGSALVAPRHPGEPGVPGVDGMLGLIREEFQRAETIERFERQIAVAPDARYQAAFRFLVKTRGQDVVNSVVRRAVLRARRASPGRPVVPADVTSKQCQLLEEDIEGWHLTPAVEALGQMLARIGPRQVVLTSNFDPLVEIGVRRAGGQAITNALHMDGSLSAVDGNGCVVVHFHGDWVRTDTLHTPAQLQQDRPMLRASLTKLLSERTLVVMGYGGWDDVFTRSLIDTVRGSVAPIRVAWAFYAADEATIERGSGQLLRQLRPGIDHGRVVLYKGIDVHEFLPRLLSHVQAPAAAGVVTVRDDELVQEAARLGAAWRRAVGERLGRRLVLRGVEGTELALERVYVPTELRVLRAKQETVDAPVDEGRCDRVEAPRDGSVHHEIEGEQTLDLGAWLLGAEVEYGTLIIEGEVGTGKTEYMVRAASRLAKDVGEDAPLPIWVDAKFLSGATLARAIADLYGWSESECRALLQHPALRFAVFIDSLDETGTPVHEVASLAQGALGPRLHRLILASRSARRQLSHGVRVARLVPWNRGGVDDFLGQWRRVDEVAVAHIARARAAGAVDALLSNPLTATFCALVASEEPSALANRTRLFQAVVERIVSHWRKLRVTSRALYRRWEEILPWLSRLALDRLRGPHLGMETEWLRCRLRALAPDGPDDLLESLTSTYGVLIRTPHGYDFALRWLAEYLAGRALVADGEELAAAARCAWGFEPVRHAIVGVAGEPRRIAAMTASLLAGEESDEDLDAPSHLRQVQIVASVAADLPLEFPSEAVPGVAAAIWRRLAGERSCWIGAEMATSVRALARVGGKVWESLRPLLQDALRDTRKDVSGWYRQRASGDRAALIKLLGHRDPETRVVAIRGLRRFVDAPDVRKHLCEMLFDEAWPPSPALAAGSALRDATRDDSCALVLECLLALLHHGEQLQFSAAALALRPGEADARRLALGLHAAHNAGADVAAAVRALSEHPGGPAALDRAWKQWQGPYQDDGSSASAGEGDTPPVTGHVRWELVRAIAPALHRFSAELVTELIRSHGIAHALSHELEHVNPSILPRVVADLCDDFICLDRITDIVRLVGQYPEVGDALLAKWRQIAASGRKERDCVGFPGQALVPLVEQGREDAVDALVEWLPHSRLGRYTWAGSGPPLPASAYAHPRVFAAAKECLERGRRSRCRLEPRALRRLAPSWCGSAEIWEEIRSSLLNDVHSELAWREVTETCTDVDLPEDFAATVASVAGAFMLQHDAPSCGPAVWHQTLPGMLRFVQQHGLAHRIQEELEVLAGLRGARPPCARFRPLAAAMLMPMLEEGPRAALSEALAAHYAAVPGSFRAMAPALLSALVGPSPAAWLQVLRAWASEMSIPELVLDDGESRLNLLLALPVHERAELASAALRGERRAALALPWLEDETAQRLRYRAADRLWQAVFESGRYCGLGLES